jgi:hypothetical protein
VTLMLNRKTLPVSISVAALLVVLAQGDAKAETRRQSKQAGQKKAQPRKGRKAFARRKVRCVRQTTRLRERAALVEPLIAAAAIKYQVDPYAIWVIAYKETRFRWWLKSPVGAEGLMQFMPATAADYGLKNSYNVPDSIDAAARYVRKAMNQFGGRLDLVWASYNAGFGAVEAYQTGRTLRPKGGKVINPRGLKTGGIPPYSETRDYVAICWKVYGAAKNSGVFSPDVLARTRQGVLPDPQTARGLLAAHPLDDGELAYLGGPQNQAFSAFTPAQASANVPAQNSPLPSPSAAVAGAGRTAAAPLEEVFYDVNSGVRYLVRGGEIVELVGANSGGRAGSTPESHAAGAAPAFAAKSVYYGARGE